MRTVEAPTAMAQLAGGPVEYRFERRGAATVVVLHGGHLRAGLPLGEDVFDELGYSILAPSRPGYGNTPLHADSSPDGFAKATAELCAHLGIDRLAAVMAISAGGRTGLAMAANHPDLVARLILEVPVGLQPWPASLAAQVGARIVFNHRWEAAVWALARTVMRRAPTIGLRAMMRSLSAEPPTTVLEGFSDDETAALAGLFTRMRSGKGFSTDLKFACRHATTTISQPTLILASRGDGAVPATQAQSLNDSIENAELVVADTTSHFLWFGPGSAEVSARIRTFLSNVH